MFSRKVVIVKYNYIINNINHQRYTEVMDLGILFDSKLTFSNHIYSICCKLLGYMIRTDCKDFATLTPSSFCLIF